MHSRNASKFARNLNGTAIGGHRNHQPSRPFFRNMQNVENEIRPRHEINSPRRPLLALYRNSSVQKYGFRWLENEKWVLFRSLYQWVLGGPRNGVRLFEPVQAKHIIWWQGNVYCFEKAIKTTLFYKLLKTTSFFLSLTPLKIIPKQRIYTK